jgi:hypothetical protein
VSLDYRVSADHREGADGRMPLMLLVRNRGYLRLIVTSPVLLIGQNFSVSASICISAVPTAPAPGFQRMDALA